ncbi:ATP-binding protein [Halohasta litorea]|uniref:histidine kinase n=1 Tax=Halohasta litorea TaxID=869891 RepID=A0ABD6D5X9_9EURY|nr:ATP-binding protein [Halohasta litorea]
MIRSQLRANSPLFIVALGTLFFAISLSYHAGEFLALGGSVGPLIAFLLDGGPAFAVAYFGYRLSGADLSTHSQYSVLRWGVGGGLLFLGVIGAMFIVHAVESRPVTEPVFSLLIAAEVGAIAGLIAGYNNAQARADARRAEVVSDALAFVNRLIRHDLRNDLSAIYGYATHIGDQPTAADSDRDPAEIIARNADEALVRIDTSHAITETLLDDPELEAVDLVPVVTEFADRIQDSFAVSVTTDLPAEAVVAANDGLRPVVDNLLENAAEHNDASEPRIAVTVDTEPETVRLRISDNGSGIPDAQQPLFETNNGATGGLSLVATLVEEYGGEIRAEASQLGGAAFVVDLPRADANDRS